MRRGHVPIRTPCSARGFTLLEVLLSFAILSIVTTLMTSIISENMEKAADAIDKRELREIADTLFGRILFEQTEHRDGDEGSVSVDYGQWAGLPQSRADRYTMYRWRLKKTEMVAAGSTDEGDAENLFGDQDESTSSTETSSESTSEEANKAAINLMRFTLIVYHQEEPNEPLVTLTRFLPPPEFQTAGTGAGR